MYVFGAQSPWDPGKRLMWRGQSACQASCLEYLILIPLFPHLRTFPLEHSKNSETRDTRTVLLSQEARAWLVVLARILAPAPRSLLSSEAQVLVRKHDGGSRERWCIALTIGECKLLSGAYEHRTYVVFGTSTRTNSNSSSSNMHPMMMMMMMEYRQPNSGDRRVRWPSSSGTAVRTETRRDYIAHRKHRERCTHTRTRRHPE